MAVDFILHIGFPKCASTTLQNRVFKQEQGYLGTHKTLTKPQNFAKQLQAISPVGPRQWSNRYQAKQWAEKVLQFHEYHFPTVDRLIASSELFVNRNKFKDRPIIDFLGWFNRNVWTHGQVKVLLVLRNPADRIASGYAQVSASNPNASQQDFTHHVAKQLRPGQQMGYAKWVRELHQKLGQENTCILLMEDIGELTFWQ